MSRFRSPYNRSTAGFAVPELLLAFGIGVGLCTLMLQSVWAEGTNSQRLARVLRERLVAQRALALVRRDLQRATRVSLGAAEDVVVTACPLAGRALLLHLETPEGPVTYSLGKASEPIWRGQVLMRCGGAFGLDGSPSGGQAINRVLLDGLASDGAAMARTMAPGVVQLQLRQVLPTSAQGSQVLLHERLLPLPLSAPSNAG